MRVRAAYRDPRTGIYIALIGDDSINLSFPKQMSAEQITKIVGKSEPLRVHYINPRDEPGMHQGGTALLISRMDHRFDQIVGLLERVVGRRVLDTPVTNQSRLVYR